MKPQTDLAAFSAFVLELHERSTELDAVSLFRWSVESLARQVGADCGWGGWADRGGSVIDVCASLSYNLPDDFDAFWSAMRRDDLLAQDVMAGGRDSSFYDRRGRRHTDGMIALCDRYHIGQMAVAVTQPGEGGLSLFMSPYRCGRRARPLGPAEMTFLHHALDHLRYLVRRDPTGRGVAAGLLATGDGRVLAATSRARQLIGERWHGWDGRFLPEPLRPSAAAGTGSARGLAIDASALPASGRGRLYGLALRPATPVDRLTRREREIAGEIVDGRTHKEIARGLGLSPATIRNHTQAILAKLGLRNKAMLAGALRDATAV